MVAKRALGDSGLETPPLVLGTNVFGWKIDEPTSFAVLDAFVAGGGTMLDTADVYMASAPGNRGGESETIIGNWLKRRGRRDDVVIATKVGLLPIDGSVPPSLAAETIRKAIDASLRRLQTDHVDLYYAHRDDGDTPLEETLDAFDALVRAGKVRAVGASNYMAERIGEALAVSDAGVLARYTVVQPEYNLMERGDFEGDLQQLCIDRNLGVTPYFGLASGFLSGRYRSEADLAGSSRPDAVRKYLGERGQAVLRAMDDVAAATGAAHAQIALAWLAGSPGVTAPIASATSVAKVEELLAAMALTLSPEQMAALDAAGRA